MKQRTALLIASGLTAFVLVGVGALIGSLNATNSRTAAASATPQVLAQPAQVVLAAPSSISTGTPQPSFVEREAQYRALIEEANRRLEQANQRLTELERRLQDAQSAQPPSVADAVINPSQPAPAMAQPQASSPTQLQVVLSPQRALEIALAAAPGTVAQRMPELVDYQGAIAYEVLLNAGPIYVDANSGVILYNGAIVPAAAVPVRVHHDEDDDHEKYEHDDHDDKHEDHDDDD